MRVLAFIVGSIATLALVVAMVRSMLITRNTRSWITRAVATIVRVTARMPLRALKSFDARDRWLSGAAPSALLLQLTLYGILFIFALGLTVWGCTDLGAWNALYQSGSTFTTLGIVVPMNGVAAVVSFVAAFLGLVVVAVFIGYLMALYGMYASRESVMARLTTYAGEPAWGPEFLARAAVAGRPISDAPNIDILLDWVSDLRLNLDMNPVLADFRSTSSKRHWVTSLLAAMDAVTLRLAMGESSNPPADIQFLTQGTTAFAAFAGTPMATWTVESHFIGVLRDSASTSTVTFTLTDDEWAEGWSEMRGAGVKCRLNEDVVRQRLEEIRSLYFPAAVTLADKHYAVRAPWSGDRTPTTPVQKPMLAGSR